MVDVFEVANLLRDHAVENYGGDIDLIGYYGSRARGEADQGSDLDIFYIPAEGKNPPIARTFLLDGLLFDFWPIRWELMAGFATGRARGWAFAPALVYYTKVLYARTDETARRLDGLRNQIDELQGPEARPQMVRRALETYPSVLAHLANLRLAVAGGAISAARFAAWNVIERAWECLALANQVFFSRGLAKSLTETDKFREKPADLDRLVNTIALSPEPMEVLQAGETLAASLREVLDRIRGTVPAQAAYRDVFRNAYPELKDAQRKLLRACERGERVAASAEAWLLQSELTAMLNQSADGLHQKDFNLYGEMNDLYSELGFPDLMGCGSGDLEELAAGALSFDDVLRHLLAEHAVDLGELESIAVLQRAL